MRHYRYRWRIGFRQESYASTLYRELREQVGDEHIGVIPKTAITKIKAICRWKNALRQLRPSQRDGSQPAA